MLNKKNGFTMVELLVVLVIIAILAAVATPLYLANTKRAKASEAVAALGLIRQAERDFQINNNTYFDIASNHLQDSLPLLADITLADGSVTGNHGVAITVGTPQYFSNASYTVEAKGTGASSTLADPTAGKGDIFSNPAPVDFLITVNGKDTVVCSSGVTNCAVKASEVGGGTSATSDDYILHMDNTGRIAVSYDGTTYSAY